MNRILSLLRSRALAHVPPSQQNHHHCHCSHISTAALPTPTPSQATHTRPARFLHTSLKPQAPLPKPHQLPPRPKIREEDITETFLKGSGPGGQKINKTASAVQLHHLPTGITLKSQATRSRTQNRKIARQLLATKIDNLTLGEGSRESIKGKLGAERKARGVKKRRRKYRALAGEGGREGVVEDGEEEEVDEHGEGEEVEVGDKPVNESEGGGEDTEVKSHGERKRNGQQKARERYEPEVGNENVVKKLFEEARERMGREREGKG